MAMAFSIASPVFLPSLSSALSGKRKNVAKTRLAASYGIPGYDAPRPYQTPKLPVAEGTNSKPAGSNAAQPVWSNYGAPPDYQTPRNYRAPQAYGQTSTELGQEGLTLEDVQEEVKAELDSNDGSGGNRGDDNDGNGGDGDGDGEEEAPKKKISGMSMSQKLTLAYAILVGVGGIMGFAKSGSSKSLMAGGGSASILYYVYLNLPSNPVMASGIGLGISGMLLFIMGSRFLESGKVFPAGVVSLYSLVMAGGYIHGIFRSAH